MSRTRGRPVRAPIREFQALRLPNGIWREGLEVSEVSEVNGKLFNKKVSKRLSKVVEEVITMVLGILHIIKLNRESGK